MTCWGIGTTSPRQWGVVPENPQPPPVAGHQVPQDRSGYRVQRAQEVKREQGKEGECCASFPSWFEDEKQDTAKNGHRRPQQQSGRRDKEAHDT